MTGQTPQKPKALVSLQSAELEHRLETTKERLNQAASQLVELARMLLVPHPAGLTANDRYLFNQLVLTQMVSDVQDAARELHKARDLATHLGDSDPLEKAKISDTT